MLKSGLSESCFPSFSPESVPSRIQKLLWRAESHMARVGLEKLRRSFMDAWKSIPTEEPTSERLEITLGSEKLGESKVEKDLNEESSPQASPSKSRKHINSHHSTLFRSLSSPSFLLHASERLFP